MGVDSFSTQAIQTLRRLSRASHLSIVLGAGASVAAGLPDWSHLVKNLLARPKRRKGSEEIAEALLQAQGFLLGAEAAFGPGVSSATRKQKIAEALFGGESRNDFEPSHLHFAVGALAQARGPTGIQLFTTNYDDLLERAFELSGLKCFSRFDFLDPSGLDSFTVHHLHGLLGRKRKDGRYLESQDIVLTQSDYDRLYRPEHDWPGEDLPKAASRGPLLFLGTTLTDPNLVRYLNRLKDRRLGPHVQVLPRQGLGVSQDLFPRFAQRLSDQWSKSNVEVVFVEDFVDVTAFVYELISSRGGVYKPPAHWLRGLWRQATKNFRRRQEVIARGSTGSSGKSSSPCWDPTGRLGSGWLMGRDICSTLLRTIASTGLRKHCAKSRIVMTPGGRSQGRSARGISSSGKWTADAGRVLPMTAGKLSRRSLYGLPGIENCRWWPGP